MTVVLVAAAEPHGGATTVAVGLAMRLADGARAVRVERLAGDDRAAGDAALFAALEFADSSGVPLEPTAVEGDLVIVEAPAGADVAALASQLGARLVAVTRPGQEPPEGTAFQILNHALRPVSRALTEDRVLAAPTVGMLAEASGARVLARSRAGDAAICEHIVIGSIALDSAEPYFEGFPRKAVVTRAEKVDIALAALRTDTTCLILTGGSDPSPYLLDRVASARDTTLLLAPNGTIETMRDIEGTFGRAAFAGDAKIERVGELMRLALDDQAVAELIG